MRPYFVYSDKYDFRMLGAEKLHPFDNRKFSRAWSLVAEELTGSAEFRGTPIAPVDDMFLQVAHAERYLTSLKRSINVARVIEISLARFLPNIILQRGLIAPVKYACMGTWMATQAALKGHIAMNFGGGFHHAFSDHGEGFCFFADAALSIFHARKAGLILENDLVVNIDLDAHRGNGFESFFNQDKAVKNFDMYNFQVYPGMHSGEVNDCPYMIPLRMGMQGKEYLEILKAELPRFLDNAQSAKLAFYNAGTDILSGDPLGGLDVSFEDVLARDSFVIGQLVKRQIPTVVMTSGGYTQTSYKLVGELAKTIKAQCQCV